jgi:hypothetical protein
MYKIYLLESTYEGSTVYKIGFTKNSIDSRIRQLSTGSIYDIILVKYYETDKYHSNIENCLHKHFYAQRINKEWFYLSTKDIDDFLFLCNKYYTIVDTLHKNNTYIQNKGRL